MCCVISVLLSSAFTTVITKNNINSAFMIFPWFDASEQFYPATNSLLGLNSTWNPNGTRWSSLILTWTAARLHFSESESPASSYLWHTALKVCHRSYFPASQHYESALKDVSWILGISLRDCHPFKPGRRWDSSSSRWGEKKSYGSHLKEAVLGDSVQQSE